MTYLLVQLVFNSIYFFGLQIVKMFTLSLLWIKLISGYSSAYGYQEHERILLQHMRGQACISVCIPQPFLSHSPPVFPHLLGHVSVNVSSPTCGSLPIYFLLAVGSLFRSVTGCTRGPVAYGLAQTALEKNHLAQSFYYGKRWCIRYSRAEGEVCMEGEPQRKNSVGSASSSSNATGGCKDNCVEPTSQSVGFGPVLTSVTTVTKYGVEAQNNFCFCP